MPLFSKNPLRSAATAAIAVSIAHYGTKLMSSLQAFQMTQTSIAIMAISALLFMIMMHHRMDGHLMSQSQEEMALIGIFALLWAVMLVGWKTFAKKHGGGSTELGFPKVSQDRSGQDPCLGDDVYCVFEEYYTYL
ncbi:hypothetical protein B0H34DRAFT_688806 [Crassisporium funariophilum]|nr:hypothetical protein B0H34DRAFT_688806 [Crassisporium funariophilum]